MCRTGNITLRCQYDGVDNVLDVVWVNNQCINNPRTHCPPSHNYLYQEVVVDSYTNLRERYRCDVVLSNETGVASNNCVHMNECEHEVQLQSFTHCNLYDVVHALTNENCLSYSCLSYA